MSNDPRTDRGVLESSGTHLPERLLDLTIDQLPERGQGCFLGARRRAFGGTLLPNSVDSDLTRRLPPEFVTQKVLGKKFAVDSPVIASLFAARTDILGLDRDSFCSSSLNKGTFLSGVTTFEAVGKHFYRLIATLKSAHDPGPHSSGLQAGYNPFILGPH